MEALSRTVMPRIRARLYAEEVPRDQRTVPLAITVSNDGDNPGVVTSARVERTDGYRGSPTPETRLPAPIGPPGNGPDPAFLHLPVGDLPRLPAPNEDVETESPGLLTATVEYRDPAVGLVTWQQSTTYRERWLVIPDPVGPTGSTVLAYWLSDEERSDPTIVGDPLARLDQAAVLPVVLIGGAVTAAARPHGPASMRSAARGPGCRPR